MLEGGMDQFVKNAFGDFEWNLNLKHLTDLKSKLTTCTCQNLNVIKLCKKYVIIQSQHAMFCTI